MSVSTTYKKGDAVYHIGREGTTKMFSIFAKKLSMRARIVSQFLMVFFILAMVIVIVRVTVIVIVIVMVTVIVIKEQLRL